MIVDGAQCDLTSSLFSEYEEAHKNGRVEIERIQVNLVGGQLGLKSQVPKLLVEVFER